MSDDIDTISDFAVICPWCGYAHDPTDFEAEHIVDTYCDECGREFAIERDYEITYSTSRIERRST